MNPTAVALVAAMYHTCIVGTSPLTCYDSPAPIKVAQPMCSMPPITTVVTDAGAKKPATQAVWCALDTGRTAPLATPSGN